MSNEITHKYDANYCSLDFFVNGELFCTWAADSGDDLEEYIVMFHKIYELGKSEQAKRIAELEVMLKNKLDLIACGIEANYSCDPFENELYLEAKRLAEK